jgi:hypothetical protein
MITSIAPAIALNLLTNSAGEFDRAQGRRKGDS